MAAPLKNNIDLGSNPNIALLVIDVQQGLFEKSTPIYQAKALLEKISTLAAAAHAAGVIVIYIQHENDSFLRVETPSWNLHPDLAPLSDDLYVRKSHSSAFEKTDLKRLLDERQVGTIVLCGLVTHGCVKAACQAGLELGYRVILVEDGHSSYSKDAPQLIEKWNEELSKTGIELMTAEQVCGWMGSQGC